MIVPFDPRQQQAAPLPNIPEQYLLAAMGQAHAEGKFHVYDPQLAGLTQKDQPMLEESIRTAKGVNTDVERRLRGHRIMDDPVLNPDRVQRPGEPVPDRERGVPGGRDVRGI